MEKKKLNELKKGVHKILYKYNSIEEKMKDFEILNEQYNVQIGIATNPNDGGILGLFVSENGKPLFAETTKEFMNTLKEDKKEFETKLNKLSSQAILSTDKLKSELVKLGNEYKVILSFEDGKIVVKSGLGSWLFFAEFDGYLV